MGKGDPRFHPLFLSVLSGLIPLRIGPNMSNTIFLMLLRSCCIGAPHKVVWRGFDDWSPWRHFVISTIAHNRSTQPMESFRCRPNSCKCDGDSSSAYSEDFVRGSTRAILSSIAIHSTNISIRLSVFCSPVIPGRFAIPLKDRRRSGKLSRNRSV
jgi:hypothetical protein